MANESLPGEPDNGTLSRFLWRACHRATKRDAGPRRRLFTYSYDDTGPVKSARAVAAREAAVIRADATLQVAEAHGAEASGQLDVYYSTMAAPTAAFSS
jgi:hypothetical protein